MQALALFFPVSVSKLLNVAVAEIPRLVAVVPVIMRQDPIQDDILDKLPLIVGKVQPFHDIVYVQALVEKVANESIEILREVVFHWFAHSTRKVSGIQAHVLPFSSIQ